MLEEGDYVLFAEVGHTKAIEALTPWGYIP